MRPPEYWLTMVGTFFVGYVVFLGGHNQRHYAGTETLVPEFWMTQLQAIASGCGAVGLWWHGLHRGAAEVSKDDPGD